MKIGENMNMGDSNLVGAIMNPALIERQEAPGFTFDFTLIGPDDGDREDYLRLLALQEAAMKAGDYDRACKLNDEANTLLKQQWNETFHNVVTNAGRNDVLDKYFKGSSYTAAWYLGLAGTGTKAAADTLASHAGWAEVTPYSGNRPAITFGTTASQSNTASAVSYTINATATVAGAFIASVNTGTSGLLYSAGDFAASRSVANGDTLNVTPTVSD